MEETIIDFNEYSLKKVFVQLKAYTDTDMINISKEFSEKKMSLKEIYEYCNKKYPNTMIYVVDDLGTHGVIYRCGNYGDGEWQRYALTEGYA